MQAKDRSEESKEVGPHFQWGKKRGVSVNNKDIQFYESFTWDEVHYKLYDCVYLFMRGQVEPFIGKILKVWEQRDGKKKVKLLWFFHPSEIVNFLGDHQVSPKEIFLASGEGVGLSNINPLEAIAAKCSVICTSNDARNPQPSEDVLERADFIFYRTFDVGKKTISDKLPDKIAGLEVELLLNRKEDQLGNPLAEFDAKKSDLQGKAEAATVSQPSITSEALKLGKAKVDKPGQDKVVAKNKSDIKGTSEVVVPGTLASENAKNDENKYDVQGKAEAATASQPPISSETLKLGKTKVDKPGQGKVVAKNKSNIKGKVEAVASGTLVSSNTKIDETGQAPHSILATDAVVEDNPQNEPNYLDGSKNSKILEPSRDEVPIKAMAYPVDKKFTSVKRKAESDLMKPSKKIKLGHGNAKRMTHDKAWPDELHPKPPASASVKSKTEQQIVSRRPQPDKQKWFKGIPWKERFQKAHEHGTLVLLQNLDRSLTSWDIQRILLKACNEQCTAKVISYFPPYLSHQSGEAYAIFKTRDAADVVVQNINRGCLILPSGRAVRASKGWLATPQKPSSLVGHLSVSKARKYQRDDVKKAVSTSHCSQPNTIEYEMAMDWILLQEETDCCFNQLHKMHADDRRKVRKNLKNNK